MIGRACLFDNSEPPVRLRSQLEKGQLLEPKEAGEISTGGGVRNDEFCHCTPPVGCVTEPEIPVSRPFCKLDLLWRAESLVVYGERRPARGEIASQAVH